MVVKSCFDSKVAERDWSGLNPQQRQAARQQLFIQAGIELFGTQGYHATTMRTLTAKAGLTNRYFYESFDTLEDLLAACYLKLIDDYRQTLNGAVAEAPNRVQDRMRAGLRCFFQAMQQPYFARITHGEVLGVSPRIDALYLKTTAEFAQMMMDNLQAAGVPVQALNPHEARCIGAALAGSVIQSGSFWVRSRYQAPLETVVAAAMKVFMGTVAQVRRSAKTL